MKIQRRSCAMTKPMPFLDVGLFFEVTGPELGYWTGHEWLVRGCEVMPSDWVSPSPGWKDLLPGA